MQEREKRGSQFTTLSIIHQAAVAIAALAAAAKATTSHCISTWAYCSAALAAVTTLALVRAAGLGQAGAHDADLKRMRAAQAALAGTVVELERAVGVGGGGRVGEQAAGSHQHTD